MKRGSIYLEGNQNFHHLLLVHFLKVLVSAHKSDEDLLERPNFFHIMGEAEKACFCLVEVTIFQDDASWCCKSIEIFLNLLKIYFVLLIFFKPSNKTNDMELDINLPNNPPATSISIKLTPYRL